MAHIKKLDKNDYKESSISIICSPLMTLSSFILKLEKKCDNTVTILTTSQKL